MTEYVDSGTRAMHRFIDASLANVSEVLHDPDYRAALSDTTHCEEQLRAIGRLFIPNIRHGQVQLKPGAESPDATPIVALPPGSVFSYGHGAIPTGQQLQGYARMLGADRLGTGAPIANQELSLPHNGAALVVATSIGEAQQNMYRIGKPLMILSMRAAMRISAPNVVVHELEHVKDFIEEPFSYIESHQRLRHELLAELRGYARDADCIAALKKIGYDFDVRQQGRPRDAYEIRGYQGLVSLSEAVDATRRAINERRRDPFYPDPAILRTLRVLDISIM